MRTFMIRAGLAGVYLFLYITLRQQDYVLLIGAIALFIVLAIVMYVTAKSISPPATRDEPTECFVPMALSSLA